MDQYIVSARKYRPETFDAVVGQETLTTTLKNSVKSGKLAHAYLFCGPRGVGKTTCARIFAKVINCEHLTADGDACDECESCKSFKEQRSLNIFELDAASHNSVEEIKSLMEQTRIPPQIGKYKVFIIDEVHMLSSQAFNAFLKTLEEPPSYVIFILATTEKSKILPTILSRCQIYDFERMSVANIISHLKKVADDQNIKYEEDAISVIAEKADGGMRDALSIFDQVASYCQGNITYDKVLEDLNVLDVENYFKIVDSALENKTSDVMVILNQLLSRGFDGLQMMMGLAKHIRNVMMAKEPQTLDILETSEKNKQRYQEQARKCPTKFLYEALRLLNQCDQQYRVSADKRLLVELVLIEITQITQEDDTVSGGRRPTRRLKSLFKKIVSDQSGKTTASRVAVVGTKRSNPKDTSKDSNVTNVTAGDGASEQTSKNGSGVKIQGVPHVTFARVIPRTTGPSAPKNTETKQEESSIKETVTEGENFFDENMLSYNWLSICNSAEFSSLAALSSRLKNMKPTITDYPNVEIVVPNENILSNVKKYEKQIETALQKSLGNNNVQLNIRLASSDEQKPLRTREEQMKELEDKYEPLGRLRRLLDLEME